MKLASFSFLKAIICLIVLSSLNLQSFCQTSCDYELQIVSTEMGNFNTKAYNPLNIQNLYDRLNSLRASILATYQLCFGRIIIDPDSLYPQDISSCFVGLYNVSLLTNIYTGNFGKIKAQIDSISKIVFSTQNDCRPVLYYKGWDNFTDDCRSNIQPLDDLFNKYDSQIILGKNGLQYVNDMILQTQRLRKICGFNVLVKANTWSKDTCIAANNNWLYPLTDQMDTLLIQKKYSNFTQAFYNLYQSLYRVKSVCNVNSQNLQVQESEYIRYERLYGAKLLTVDSQ